MAVDVACQVAADDERIIGVMIESNLVAGRQDVVPAGRSSMARASPMAATTETVLHGLAGAVVWRRSVKREILASRQGAA